MLSTLLFMYMPGPAKFRSEETANWLRTDIAFCMFIYMLQIDSEKIILISEINLKKGFLRENGCV